MNTRYIFTYFVVVALLAIGFYSILLPKQMRHMRRDWKSIEKKMNDQTLKKLGGKKLNWYDKFKIQAEEVLKLSNSKMTYSNFLTLTITTSVIGCGVGMMMYNPLLAAVLGVVGFLVPLQVLRIKLSTYTQYYNEQLHSALLIITNAYMQSNDIVQAVKDNLEHLEEPLFSVFSEFVAANKLVDSNIEKNVRIMKTKVDNYSFHEWCDSLILCQENREIKFVLPAIVEQIADLKVMQEEVNTMMYQIYREYLTVSGLVVGSIPAMYFLNKDWFAVLINTMGGKIIIAVVLLIEALLGMRVIKINEPIEIG